MVLNIKTKRQIWSVFRRDSSYYCKQKSVFEVKEKLKIKAWDAMSVKSNLLEIFSCPAKQITCLFFPKFLVDHHRKKPQRITVQYKIICLL